MRLIGIGGPSGSGKTELARALAAALEAPVISLDSYYRDLGRLTIEERARINFDAPEAIEIELLLAHARALARDGAAQVPVYDFALHTRTERVRAVQAGRYAILEGLWALYWAPLRHLLAVKAYVETAEEVRFARRLDRDVRERGRSPESVRAQYAATAGPMAALYILPTRRFADVVVSGVAPIEESVAAVRAVL